MGYYQQGIITLTAGQIGFGVTPAALLSNSAPGDSVHRGGFSGVIATITSNTTGTLAAPWGGASYVGGDFQINHTGDNWHSTVQINERAVAILAQIESGLPMRPDAAGSLADRALLDDAPEGFIYARSDVDPWIFYVKQSADPADWSLGATVRGLTGAPGPQGNAGLAGWSPAITVVADGARDVLLVVDWIGGQGLKPATGVYLGGGGFTSDIAAAINIRGPQGPQGTPGDDGQEGWSPALTVVLDGARAVIAQVDWVAGTGLKPSTPALPSYLGAGGWTSNIASAIDIRGPSGPGTGSVNPNAGPFVADQLVLAANSTGTIIKPGGPVPPTGYTRADGSGRTKAVSFVEAQVAGPVRLWEMTGFVDDYDRVGGGGTDNTTPFQNAMRKGFEIGRPVQAPATYIRVLANVSVDSTAATNYGVPKGGLIGYGSASTFFVGGLGAYNFLELLFGSVAQITLKGFSMQKVDFLGSGIRANRASYFTIEDVFAGGFDVGIDLPNSFTYTLRNLTLRENRVNLRMRSEGVGAAAAGPANIHLVDCDISQAMDWGWEVYGGATIRTTNLALQANGKGSGNVPDTVGAGVSTNRGSIRLWDCSGNALILQGHGESPLGAATVYIRHTDAGLPATYDLNGFTFMRDQLRATSVAHDVVLDQTGASAEQTIKLDGIHGHWNVHVPAAPAKTYVHVVDPQKPHVIRDWGKYQDAIDTQDWTAMVAGSHTSGLKLFGRDPRCFHAHNASIITAVGEIALTSHFNCWIERAADKLYTVHYKRPMDVVVQPQIQVINLNAGNIAIGNNDLNGFSFYMYNAGFSATQDYPFRLQGVGGWLF